MQKKPLMWGNKIKPDEISKIEIPTGSPFVINYESGKVINYKYLS